MIQSLTKPQEGETAAESIQIALAASAPNGNNTHGSFAPQTTAGKALTCYIAIVGIAWFAFILSILGDHLLAFVAWVDRKVRCNNVGSETTKFHIFVQALIWNGGSRGRVRYQRCALSF
jgi:hypothetical protein